MHVSQTWLSITLALGCQLATRAQDPAILIEMDWVLDAEGKYQRNYSETTDSVTGLPVFGHLFQDENGLDLLPVSWWKYDPASHLRLILTGKTDSTACIDTRRLYQVLEKRHDVGSLRKLMRVEGDPSDRELRLDQLIALRYAEQFGMDGLIGAVHQLTQSQDPWLSRAGKAAPYRLMGDRPPGRPPAIPPAKIQADSEVLVYLLPARIPDAAPLYAAFKQIYFELAQLKLRAHGSSMSPAQLVEFQDAIDLPGLRPYEMIRRFGLWQLDSYLFCIDTDPKISRIFIEAKGEFEYQELRDGLLSEGVDLNSEGQADFLAQDANLELHASANSLQVRSKESKLIDAGDSQLDLRGNDLAAIAQINFESLSRSHAWIGNLGNLGTLKLAFTKGKARVTLETDGNAKSLRSALESYLKTLVQRAGSPSGTRSPSEISTELDRLEPSTVPLEMRSILALFQFLRKLEVQETQRGLRIGYSIDEGQIEAVTLVWFAIVMDQQLQAYLHPRLTLIDSESNDEKITVECRLTNHSSKILWYRGDLGGKPGEFGFWWRNARESEEEETRDHWHEFRPGQELSFRHSLKRRPADQLDISLNLYRWKNTERMVRANSGPLEVR